MVVTATVPRSQPAPAASPPPSRNRSRFRGVSRAAALTWLAGTLAFVLSASVLRDRAERIEVLVAARDIPAGTELTPAMIRPVELDADSPLAKALVRRGGVRPGMIVSGAILKGSPIRTADLASATAGDRLRSMSIQVDRAQAVGGDLRVGDRVDVIRVVDGTPAYVVTGVQVISVASSQGGRGLTASSAPGGFFVVVRVDAREALALAGAMERGGLQVVRSTGAEPVAAGTTPATAKGGEG